MAVSEMGRRGSCGGERSVWETGQGHWIARGGGLHGEKSVRRRGQEPHPWRPSTRTTGIGGSSIYFQTWSLCTLVASQNPSCSLAFSSFPASGWTCWSTCPPRAHQSGLTVSINTSLSWCRWGAGSGCVPWRLAAPELRPCSQASSPLGFCPCIFSGLSSFLPTCFLHREALFRGLDPLSVGVGLASVLILSSFCLLWAFPLILVIPVAFFKLMCIRNLSLVPPCMLSFRLHNHLFTQPLPLHVS